MCSPQARPAPHGQPPSRPNPDPAPSSPHPAPHAAHLARRRAPPPPPSSPHPSRPPRPRAPPASWPARQRTRLPPAARWRPLRWRPLCHTPHPAVCWAARTGCMGRRRRRRCLGCRPALQHLPALAVAVLGRQKLRQPPPIQRPLRPLPLPPPPPPVSLPLRLPAAHGSGARPRPPRCSPGAPARPASRGRRAAPAAAPTPTRPCLLGSCMHEEGGGGRGRCGSHSTCVLPAVEAAAARCTGALCMRASDRRQCHA